jgi:hypothetical protein
MSIDLILGKVRQWEARRSSDGSVDDAVRRQIARALEPILGQGAVSRVLPPPGESSRLLADAERVLVTFLGAKAASALLDRAMDRATMRS